MADDEPRSSWSASASSTEYSGLSSSADLVGEEDDLLIPTASNICRTYHDGRATWANLVKRADRFPTEQWPAGSLDPYAMLMDVPSLPKVLPRRKLIGRPLWHVPGIDTDPSQEVDDDTWDSELIYGRRFALSLETKSPILCDFSMQAASSYLRTSSETTHSLAILTLCWSYILSANLLEMQGRKIKYSSYRLRPRANDCTDSPRICLDGASAALTRWLCAILSPGLGWSTLSGKDFPPWTASLKQPITIIVSKPVLGSNAAPSTAEATELLLELCGLFNLGTNINHDKKQHSLPPYTAGLFAALMLPFYRFKHLQPKFTHPRLALSKDNRLERADTEVIRQYVQDLRYFSTLSMHPPSIGSILWSMFWQPDVDCNLVSPWLASIIDVLKPAVETQDLTRLLKVFCLRRPRVAPWWLGMFLLGDLSALAWIQRYANTLAEQYGCGTLSPPDPMVSAWTGSKQSFLDHDSEAVYLSESDEIPRADVLRRRFNRKLHESGSIPLSWRPFGCMEKCAVELDLWPYLEIPCVRQYKSFTWYLSRGDPSSPDSGFRADTGRHVLAVPDRMVRISATDECQQCPHCIKLTPSKDSTLRMMSFLVEDANGGRHWPNSGMPGVMKQYPWLRYWEGLDGMEVRETTTKKMDSSDHEALQEQVEKWLESHEASYP